MDSQNIKVYLAISGALIVLFILVLIIPFTKKNPTQDKTTKSTNQLFPTSVETNPSPATANVTPVTIKAGFTGALEETIPQQIVDLASQKKDLKLKVPLNLSTFSIDFDYSTDKFVVALLDPKDQAKKEFESWRTANYPSLGSEQFLLK
ncbi:MAG: hypothetical protein COZ34_00485 [Candidatus Pacebacteria bacterium CG_4_10_14_3_um_filter_34_15]|nr:MAG: hypothetical protein COZ34_00485 [Candidatus Pacebacteria bacterium CG_4_10_14_3_um_filter_34_15]